MTKTTCWLSLAFKRNTLASVHKELTHQRNTCQKVSFTHEIKMIFKSRHQKQHTNNPYWISTNIIFTAKMLQSRRVKHGLHVKCLLSRTYFENESENMVAFGCLVVIFCWNTFTEWKQPIVCPLLILHWCRTVLCIFDCWLWLMVNMTDNE